MQSGDCSLAPLHVPQIVLDGFGYFVFEEPPLLSKKKRKREY